MNFIWKYVLLLILDFSYENFKSLICSISLLFQRVTEVAFFEVATSSQAARSSTDFVMLRLARLVSQFPTQYFGKLPGFNLSKLTRRSGVFPRLSAIF